LAALIATRLGESAKAKGEYERARKCILGILGTGDGSQGRPYVVTRVSDEYDIVRHLNKRSEKQALQIVQGKYLDVLFCADGDKIWFDVTDPFRALGRQLRGK